MEYGRKRAYNGRYVSPRNMGLFDNDSHVHSLICCSVIKTDLMQVLDECVQQQKNMCFVYHDPKTTPDIPSEYETPHYHGLVRSIGNGVEFERVWMRVRDHYRREDGWFKIQKVMNVASVCAYFQMPGKEVVLNHLKGTTLEAWQNVQPDKIEELIEKKTTKAFELKERVDVINKLREYILKTACFNETELVAKLHSDAQFEALFKGAKFDQALKKALTLASHRIMDMTFGQLVNKVKELHWDPDEFYSIDASTALVRKIMQVNKIPFVKFLNDAICLMDRRKPKVNCLWFHGKTNAGKSYLARAFQRIAMDYHSVPSGSNRFMFQNCVNKRLIVMNEPFLDESAIEATKEVLEGTGCYVPVKAKADQYLRSTPVLITSNTYLWQFNSQAKEPLLSRCFKGYLDMQTCDFLKLAKKELHPLFFEKAIATLFPVLDLELGSGAAISKDEKEPMFYANDVLTANPIPKAERVVEEDPYEKELESEGASNVTTID